MGEHYERHRSDAELLAEVATGRGMPITPERAYRAWIRHSDGMAAGWMMLPGDAGEPDLDMAFQVLERELASLAVEDIGIAVAEGRDVERLVSVSDAEGFALSREDVVRIWADHSACEGRDWIPVGDGRPDEVLGRHAVTVATEPGQAP